MLLRSLIIERERKDGSCVFVHLKRYRAKTNLDTTTTRAVEVGVEQVVNQYKDRVKCFVLGHIARAILDELMKSVEVDEGMLIKCLELYPGVGETDEYDIRKLSLKSEFPGKKKKEEEEEERPLPETRINKIAEKAIRKYGEVGMETIKRESKKLRFTLKQGQEEQVLRRIIFFLTKVKHRFHCKHALQSSLELFMEHLQAYAATFCVLKDLETVHRAIENVDLSLFQDDKELKKNNVSIQEEGSATGLMNKMKPEEYLQTEDCGSATRSNAKRKHDELLVC